jgi:RecJ-like exonuclease
LHDRTAESILTEVSKLPHANVTTVPFHFDAWLSDEVIEIVPRAARGKLTTSPKRAVDRPPLQDVESITPIGDVRWRDHVRVKGVVRSVRVAPQHDVPTLEWVIDDGTGTIMAVFLGRRELAGVKVGSRIEVTGTAGVHQNRLAILNPSYRVLTGSGSA